MDRLEVEWEQTDSNRLYEGIEVAGLMDFCFSVMVKCDSSFGRCRQGYKQVLLLDGKTFCT